MLWWIVVVIVASILLVGGFIWRALCGLNRILNDFLEDLWII